MESVYCAVRAESLNIVHVNLSIEGVKTKLVDEWKSLKVMSYEQFYCIRWSTCGHSITVVGSPPVNLYLERACLV